MWIDFNYNSKQEKQHSNYIFNKKNALGANFFKLISIFLEKFPDQVYTENILKIFLNLGKSLFSIIDECELSFQVFIFSSSILKKSSWTKGFLQNSQYHFKLNSGKTCINFTIVTLLKFEHLWKWTKSSWSWNTTINIGLMNIAVMITIKYSIILK